MLPPHEIIRLRATPPFLICPRDSRGEAAGAPRAYPIATPSLDQRRAETLQFSTAAVCSSAYFPQHTQTKKNQQTTNCTKAACCCCCCSATFDAYLLLGSWLWWIEGPFSCTNRASRSRKKHQRQGYGASEGRHEVQDSSVALWLVALRRR